MKIVRGGRQHMHTRYVYPLLTRASHDQSLTPMATTSPGNGSAPALLNKYPRKTLPGLRDERLLEELHRSGPKEMGRALRQVVGKRTTGDADTVLRMAKLVEMLARKDNVRTEVIVLP